MDTAGWLSAAVEKIWLFLGRDGRIFFNQSGHDTAQGFNAQRKGVTSSKEHLSHRPFKTPRLNRRTHGHHFIGVHAFVGLFTERLS